MISADAQFESLSGWIKSVCVVYVSLRNYDVSGLNYRSTVHCSFFVQLVPLCFKIRQDTKMRWPPCVDERPLSWFSQTINVEWMFWLMWDEQLTIYFWRRTGGALLCIIVEGKTVHRHSLEKSKEKKTSTTKVKQLAVGCGQSCPLYLTSRK
jgi:hypothetical protein